MQTILSIVQKINFYLSDYILVLLLVGTGIFFTVYQQHKGNNQNCNQYYYYRCSNK